MACNQLGVRGDGISAELRKMLLYEKGTMVKHHDDSTSVNVDEGNSKPVKADELKGMFATLVISLPSAHWGGAVIVSHNGQRHSLQTHRHEYLAW